MAEELQAGVCGEKWWINNSSRSGFMASPNSVGLNDFSSFGWRNIDHVLEMKSSKCCYNSDTVNQKPKHNQQAVDSISEGSGSILIDSTIQMMGFGLSPTTSSPISSDFNPALLQEIGLTGSSSKNQNDWNPINSESDISCGFPISSSTSKLLQGLFDDEESQPHQSLCNSNNNNRSILSNYSSNNSNTINPGLFSSNSFMRPSVPKQQNGGLPFSDNTTPFWNHSAAAAAAAATAGAGLNDITGALFPPSQSQFLAPTFEDEPNFHTLITNKIKDSGSVVKKSTGSDHNQPVMKRPRIETPSPLPTFKVRKEKLGDRITALQQLVSPFGKTDTASVLHEAIDHIKFLHHQVGILSTPYLKNGASNNINPRQESSDNNLQDPECRKQDLKSRGLCLVPISSTFTVGNETTAADIWTPRSSFS